MTRELDWEGCFNVRDLGGMPAAGGRRTRRGAVVRADTLDRLTPAGWEALAAYGIRTVVDLRDEKEYAPLHPRPEGIGLVRVPVDELAGGDRWWAAWGEVEGTPLTWVGYLDGFPQIAARVATAVAEAGPGGVVVHCAAGRDRTGFASFVLLSLAGVETAEIVADYALSGPNCLRAAAARDAEADETDLLQTAMARSSRAEAVMARAGKTFADAIADASARFDSEPYLRRAGAAPDVAAKVRARLLGDAG